MPEIGEQMELYLPTSREHEAYVTDSLRQHRYTMGQPGVKAWRHAQGSGVDMSEQELTLSTSGAFSITLHEGSGITVSSPGNMQIQGGHVKLDAGQELSLEAGSALYLKGGASSMVLDGETDIKAPVIDQEGTVKAPVFVMDLPPVPEPPLMSIKAYEAAQSAVDEGCSQQHSKDSDRKDYEPGNSKKSRWTAGDGVQTVRLHSGDRKSGRSCDGSSAKWTCGNGSGCGSARNRCYSCSQHRNESSWRRGRKRWLTSAEIFGQFSVARTYQSVRARASQRCLL